MSISRGPLFRILDANFNRAREALRVCEEILRLGLNARMLSAQMKAARHACSKILIAFPVPYRRLLACRDSERDVGRRRTLADAGCKPRIRDLFLANIKRAQEALRVLEEFSKIAAPGAASRFQALRFKVYGLEKKSLPKF
ncbi:MAG: thiamine-phosphate pyrophosphorylase [Candidatus Omnitrophota bacterium]